MNDSPPVHPPVPDDSASAAIHLHWPLRLHCSRIEQLLVLALRLLTPAAEAHDRGMRVLAALCLSDDGKAAFNQLCQLLESGQWGIRLLSAESAQVCMDELDLLACLDRLLRARSLDGSMALSGMQRPNALQRVLHRCAEAMREAGLSLRPRTLSPSGRRFIEHE